MKTLYLILISFIIFSSCSSLNQKVKTGSLSPENETRRPAATGEKIYRITVSQFMTKSRMSPAHRGPLLEVSKFRGPYRLLHHNSCVEVKESDFKDLDLTIIFFTRNPVDICGQYGNGKCSPAHYAFSAGSSHGAAGEVIKTISAEANPLHLPIIVSKRKSHSYSNNCYAFDPN